MRRKENLGQNTGKCQCLLHRGGRIRNGKEGVVTNSNNNISYLIIAFFMHLRPVLSNTVAASHLWQ